jgi:hypothetical protein
MQMDVCTKTEDELTSSGYETVKKRHSRRSITDIPYVPLDEVTMNNSLAKQ